MRISITYLYTILKYGYPHSVDDALRGLPEMRRLGFRFIEMEGLGKQNLAEFYQRRREIRQALDDCGLHVHNFCVVDPDMVSTNLETRRQALDRFRMGAEIVELLGAETLHLASYAPPVEYLEGRPYGLSTNGYKFENVTRLRIPQGLEWSEVWTALVESTQICADIAAGYNRTVLMEPRVGEVICSVDSLLRLIEHVDRPNLKANFDTAHFSAQRENAVLALAKLKGHFANVHIADNDPSNSDHVAIGEGCIDWKEFLSTLHSMNYDGYLGLDLGASNKLLDGYQRSVERLQAIASDLNIHLEV
ncbi:MAG TPA: sugar phosphate isomerase/epimerase family protein [Bryobacteraceae bacterium]|nr:sugar phosphate isomerase/epimerase family protein [Bryobacteraceae bacterium]